MLKGSGCLLLSGIIQTLLEDRYYFLSSNEEKMSLFLPRTVNILWAALIQKFQEVIQYLSRNMYSSSLHRPVSVQNQCFVSSRSGLNFNAKPDPVGT
jgi:hypothetical protein